MILAALLLALELSGGDADLVERLRRREPQALAELYDRFGRTAYSIILAIVRDSGTAEDLVQETFLRVWNRAHAFDAGRGALSHWLLAIAHNRAIDHVRSAAARYGRNTFEIEERDHPSLFMSTETALVNADKAKILRASIANLTDTQRKVIELAYYEGLSQTEIAKRMEQPLGTVKTWARSALQKLRKDLDRESF